MAIDSTQDEAQITVRPISRSSGRVSRKIWTSAAPSTRRGGVRRPRRTGGLVGPGHRTTHMRFSLHNSNYASIGISMIPPFRANAFQTSHSNPTWQRLKPAKSHPSIDLRLKEFSSCAPMVLLPEPTCPQIATERCGRSSSDIALDS